MPVDVADKPEAPSDGWEDVEDPAPKQSIDMPYFHVSKAKDVASERLPNTSRKRTKISTSGRWNEDAGYRSKTTKRPTDRRSRHIPAGATVSKDPLRQRSPEYDEDDEEIEELNHTPWTSRRQSPTGSVAHTNGRTSAVTAQRARQPSQRYPGSWKYDNRIVSPVTGFGDGNNDPFSALPSDLPKAFVTQRLYGIRGIICDLVSRGPSGAAYGHAFAAAVMTHTTSHEPLFYSMVHSEMIFARTARGIEEPSPLELEIGTKAIQLVSQDIRDPNRALSDANIWAVLNLGYTGAREPLRVGKYPHQSFLKELQSIHIYCKLVVEVAHVMGLIKIITMLGGLDKIKVQGTAATISFCGVTGACRSLSRPIFPFIPFSDNFLVDGRLSLSDQERDWALTPLARLGSGFWEVWGWFPPAEMGELCAVIQHICDFTIIVENHIQGRWTPKTFTVIIDQRNFVQHSLMSLKTQQELYDSDSTMDEPLYECCRLAAIVYSLLVIFPLPPVFGPFEGLANQLQLELTLVSLDDQTVPRSRLILWTLVMGAIAAIGCPERPWFVSKVRELSARMNVGKWAELKEILQSFLWLPSTNDPDGRDLWLEMQDEPLPRT